MVVQRTAGFRGLYYPRRHCLVRGSESQNPNLIYLGESCAGKRHFDCIGFVCYVLREAVNRMMRFNLPATGCGNWLQLGSTDCGDNVAMCAPGDLVLSATHIAIVSSTGSSVRVIHANGDMPGVVETGFDRTRGNTWSRNFHAIHLSRTFLGLR
jgi:cell wall-associated NlpC family hydrolase